MAISKFIITQTPKSHCPQCGGSVVLLAREDMAKSAPMFYICWTCNLVSQVGVGPVQREG